MADAGAAKDAGAARNGVGSTVVPAQRRIGELVGIQYLRGIAAMLVVAFHLEPQLLRMGYSGPWLPGLSGGVDLFFVISGLIMWITTYGRATTSLGFWRRRIIRIVPLYWIMTTFMVVMMAVAPQVLQSSRFELRHVILSYLFLPTPHPVLHVMEPVVVPGWTLNYEMFFYLIFGVSLLAPLRFRLAAVIVPILIVITIGYLGDFQKLGVGGFYTSSVMLEFVFGLLLGAMLTGGASLGRVPAAAGWVMLIVGLAGVVFLVSMSGLPRAFVSGLPAAVAVTGALIVEARGVLPQAGLLRIVGNASYSIYLSQIVTMSAASQMWRKLHLDLLPGGLVLFCLFTVAVTALAGCLCYRYVELPLIHLFRDRPRAGAAIRRTE